jgi:DHA1 family bicyclomycin/chloramphenicol resistance-like MFS transporter
LVILSVLQSSSVITQRQRITFILLLGGLMTLMPFTIDPYLPSFPNIAKYFSASQATIQFTLTGVTLGFALGQILAGPLSDALGRRRPLLAANLLFALGAVGSFLAPNVELFFAARVLMALGASAATVVAAAVIRDLYVGLPMVKMLSRVYLIQGAAPILGPILGSQLLRFVSWQQLFLIFGVFSALILVLAARYLVETLHFDDRRSSGFAGMVGRFRAVLRDRIYVGLVAYAVLQTVALFCYLNVVSYLFQDGYGLSAADFGFLFAINSACSFVGLQVVARLSRTIAPQWLLVFAASFASLSGLGLVAVAYWHLPIWVAATCFALFIFNFGASFTPISAISLAQHGSEAGTAASLMGVLNFVITSLVSPLFGFISVTDAGGVGWVIAGCYGLALASLFFIVRPRTVPAMAK